MQPVAGPDSEIPQVARLLVVETLASGVADLSLVDLSAVDTIIVNDRLNVTADAVLTLPKIGSFRAPVGLILTLRKCSTIAHAVNITPNALDSIQGTNGAYPSAGAVGAANTTALPTSVSNDVTIQATDLGPAVVAGPPAQAAGIANPAPGAPTLGALWVILKSSVASA